MNVALVPQSRLQGVGMESIADRLANQLETIVVKMDELLDHSTISDDRQSNREALASGIFMFLPDWSWGKLDDAQRQLQRELLELWTPWAEQFRLLFSGDTTETQESISEAEKKVTSWIQRDDSRDFTVPSSINEAKALFRSFIAPFVQLLQSLSVSAGQDLMVVPDTNVLIRSPDITKYGTVLGTSKYTVLLLPGVLRELDEHKTNHRNQAVREKARAFGDRIKGWRKQGNLAKGVKVQGDIFVRVIAEEPDFENTLGGLDRTVVDDRIIASILEVQRRAPRAKVVLMSGDSIMLAKADGANIPTEDTPDPEV